MMSVFECVEERLLVYTGMAFHGYGLWTWYFSGEGKLYYTNCPYEKELQTFFYLGKCLDYAIERCSETEAPFMMSDSVGLVWLGEYIVHPGAERRFVVVGPAFQDRSSVYGISEELNRMGISRELQLDYLKLLQEMPVVTLQQFHCLAKSLHYVICFEDVQNLKIRYQTSEGREFEPLWRAKTADYEQESYHEKMILQYIRDGNAEACHINDLFGRYDSNGFMGQSSVRTAKNIVLILTSHCGHAAVEGGLPVQAAKELESEFCRRAERARTATSLAQLCTEMMVTFAEQVAQCKDYAVMSQPVSLCCSHIRNHLTDPLTLAELAELTGYTEYYLARKFQKEMGEKILDYIKRSRLDYARILLSSTNLTVEEISGKLQFGTRNYFTKKFKEYIGVNPTEYRKNAWKAQNGETHGKSE